jgi:NAD(P)-dependent dehydrogenase (short-subunit alcohol dehydrogenase family)
VAAEQAVPHHAEGEVDGEVDGEVQGCGAVLPQLAALDVLSPTGSITFVTAASAGAAMPGTAGLAAANASVAAMVPVLAVELAPVRFNAVSPGIVDTPWWDWMDADAKAETFAAYAKSTPAGRCGHPEDIADAISFLLGNSFTTGVVLTVDGGARLASGA